MNRFIVNGLVLFCVLAAILVGKHFILGGARPVVLTDNSSYGAIAATLRSAHGGTYQPIEGKDYTISHTQSLDYGQWLVVSVSPIGSFSDPGVIVLEKNANSYKAVLGPSNSLNASETDNLPADVANYLRQGSTE